MVDYKYSELFQKDSVDKQVEIAYSGGTITNTELFSESLTLTESLCSESNLTFGCCEASSLTFKIGNTLTSLIGQTITPQIILDGNSDVPFTLGTFKVASDKPTSDRKHREITAYDAMYDIINADMKDWYNSILPYTESTTTLKDFRASFAKYFGLTEANASLVNDSMVIERTIDPDKLSGKDVLTAICEINGCFGHIGRDGKLHYIYLKQGIGALYPRDDLYPADDLYPMDEESVVEIPKENYITVKYEDYTTKGITQLQVRQEENDVGAVVGEEGNAYIIEDNFLVYGKNADDLKTIAENILSKISGVVFRPFEADTKGNPCFEVGDAVRFYTTYQVVVGYILTRTLKGIQALRDTLTAEGEEEYTEDVNSINSSIVQLKGKTNTLERSVEETKSTITDVEKDLQSQITQNAESISAEVTRATKGEEALSTKVSQTAHSIKLTVNNGSTSSGISIQLTDANGNEIGTDSANIEMTGLVSFSDLSTSGKTTINGSNITTGTIDANVVNVKNVVAASVAAEDITGTTISGKTLESSSSVYKVVVSEGRLRFYYNDTLKGTISSFLNYAGTNYESTISGIKIDNDLYIGSQLMIGGTAISNYTLYAKGDARITGTIYGGSSAYPVVLGKYTGGSMTIYVLSNVLQIYQGGTVYNVDVSSSDIRLKENIDDTKLTSLDIVNRMQLREFDWKESGKHQDIGFIADELEELDECFVVGGGYADEEQTIMDVKSIDTLYLCAHLAKAIQEQQTQIEELKRQLLK